MKLNEILDQATGEVVVAIGNGTFNEVLRLWLTIAFEQGYEHGQAKAQEKKLQGED